MSLDKGGVLAFQSFSTFLKFLHLAVKAFAGSLGRYGAAHPCTTVVAKSSLSNQWFSNLKIWPFGIFGVYFDDAQPMI